MAKEKASKATEKEAEVTAEDIEEKAASKTKKEKTKEEKPADEKSNAEEKESVAEEKEEENTQYLRLMADFQNYKKRVEKEKSDIYAFANEKLIGEMLDVIDNFERALSQNNDVKDGFAEGMSMIFKQLMGVLTKAGLEEIEAQGQEFDPNFHNAVMTEETTEYESGKVTAVLQKGYLLNKKVIRPSMVKVAQ